MKFLSYILLVICLIMISCEQPPNPERCLLQTNIYVPKKYKLISFKSDWAVGESTEDYTLLISTEDYQRVIREIEGKSFFQRLDTGKFPMQVLNNNTDKNKINEVACWYDNKYSYQIFRPDPGVIITIVLEKNSLMGIYYEDL